MSIAIDTRWLHVQAGVANQISGLIKGLAACDKERDYLLFGFDAGLKQANFKHYNLTGIRRKFYQGLWKTIKYPTLEYLIGEQDIVHFTNATMAPLSSRRTKTVLTIHDLAFLHYPETIERRNLRFLQKFCPDSIRRADRIVAVSNHTKKDILDNFNVLPEKIVVIPNAASDVFCPQEAEKCQAALAERYGIKKPYILFVGTLEPRKNVALLIKACGDLPNELQEKYAMVLVGMKGWRQSALQKEIEKLNERMDVITPGYVPFSELPLFYGAADVFVFPSLFEGFGIPPLEAMSCGVPVLAANNSSLPEVIESAGVLFSDNDADDLRHRLIDILHRSDVRESLKQHGLLQARKFSWLESGKKIKALYEELLSS